MGQINRAQIITLSNAAYQLEQYSESKKVLVAWLHKFPNDLWIRYRLAIILYKLGEFEKAIRLSEMIVSEDPEFYEVWGLLAVLYPELSSDRKMAEYRARKLQETEEKSQKGLKALFRWNSSSRREEVAVENDEFDILTAVTNAKLLLNDEDRVSSCRILNIYYRRWPQTIQFKLILGHILNQMQRLDEGMAIIQSAVNADITGQVGKRIWKEDNPYKNLWVDPSVLGMETGDMKLSPDIVRLAGMENLLFLYDAAAAKVEMTGRAAQEVPAVGSVISSSDFDEESAGRTGETSEGQENAEPSLVPDSERAADTAASRENNKDTQLFGEEKLQLSGSSILSGKGGVFSGIGFSRKVKEENIPIGEYVYRLKAEDADNRKPVYVIMSSVAGLNRKYGSNNKDFINKEMNAVADAVSNRKGWTAQVFYPDEYASIGTSGPSAKMLHQELVKLDKSLKEKNQMIGALLIVGGDDVVPFFSLRNPTGDSDTDVPSDAPYGAMDSDRCYEMQWPVGRIPGDGSKDPGLLMQQLRNIQDYHILRYSSQKTVDKQRKNVKKNSKKTGKCFGYTCAAWLTPSTIVYKTISDTSSLSVCPATTSSNFPLAAFDSCDYGYFNLHGIKGKPNWYGQKRNDDMSNTPRIPTALEISNVTNIKNTPKVVFAECCYGAETPRRYESDCMSLHFLGKATRVFVGSTTIAYGALNSTLVAADLLGYLFWKHLLTGISCGEAFRRAKKNLATEMEQKNGGLDAEIQKTLISFVFYGDPLYTVDENANINDIMQRSKTPRDYELLGEESNYENVLDPEMSSDIYKEVKRAYNISSAANEYSQFMVKKEMNYNLTGRYTAHAMPEHSNFVITYIRGNRIGNVVDRSVIRVTVRDDGKIQKVSFSR